jgi:hypothetical protein
MTKPEQSQSMDEWRSMVVVNLLRRCPNLSKHELRELAAHFQSRLPNAQPEQPDLRKAADMALEALLTCDVDYDYDDNPYNTFDAEDVSEAIDALRQALIDSDGTFINEGTKQDHGFDRTASHMAGEYVDTSLPKQAIYEYSEMGSKTRIRAAKTWQGLTEQEISEVLGSDIHQEQSGELRFIRAIEEKLRDKNT